MARVVDNLIALRIIYLLITPFDKTDAYKLGLIDSSGRRIKKAETGEEKNATSMLHRLVWNIKKLINIVPGGSTKIGSLAAAMLLVKEGVKNNWTEERLLEEFLMFQYTPSLEEETLVEDCLEKIKILEDGEGIANVTGSGTSTDTPTKMMIKNIIRRKRGINHVNMDP